MENYVRKYRPFLLFLGKFFLCYVVLTVAYQAYLSQFDDKGQTDAITNSVAAQTEMLMRVFGANGRVEPHPDEPSVKLFFNEKYVARIIEGCNAVSIMILFVAFVVAFTGKRKQTLIFIFIGILTIHVLNIGRIAMLSAAMYYYPERQHLLHGVIFPLVIYSVVFALWVVWVNKFSLHAKKTVVD